LVLTRHQSTNACESTNIRTEADERRDRFSPGPSKNTPKEGVFAKKKGPGVYNRAFPAISHLAIKTGLTSPELDLYHHITFIKFDKYFLHTLSTAFLYAVRFFIHKFVFFCLSGGSNISIVPRGAIFPKPDFPIFVNCSFSPIKVLIKKRHDIADD